MNIYALLIHFDVVTECYIKPLCCWNISHFEKYPPFTLERPNVYQKFMFDIYHNVTNVTLTFAKQNLKIKCLHILIVMCNVKKLLENQIVNSRRQSLDVYFTLFSSASILTMSKIEIHFRWINCVMSNEINYDQLILYPKCSVKEFD